MGLPSAGTYPADRPTCNSAVLHQRSSGAHDLPDHISEAWTWWVGVSQMLPSKHPPSMASNPAERPCFITELLSQLVSSL